MGDELILAAQRAKFADWIDNHEYVAAYPSLSVCIEDQIVGGQRELREALRELVAETEEMQEGYCQMLEGEWASTVDGSEGPALTRAKALLVQSAAGEEARRG